METELAGNALIATVTFRDSTGTPVNTDPGEPITWTIYDHARREFLVDVQTTGDAIGLGQYRLTHVHEIVETIYVECRAMVGGADQTERAKVVVRWVDQ